MQLDDKQLVENYNNLIKYIDVFEGERKDNITKLYEDYNEKILFAPASSKEFYHSCFPGGYVVHTLNVLQMGEKLIELWEQMGANINFTHEEFVMTAMNHDLGKIGDLENDLYLPNDNDWRKNNLDEIYKINPKITNMEHQDRTLWIIQSYGIKLTENEWLSIKLHGGPYTESNKYYYLNYDKYRQFKTMLPVLLYSADVMAATIEYNNWKSGYVEKKTNYIATRSSKIEKALKKKTTQVNKDSLKNMFDDLFNS